MLDDYWLAVRSRHPLLPEKAPPAWAFGATPDHADELLALVLSGTKTATSSALHDYEAAGEPLPREGDLSIVLDGQDRAAAVIRTLRVEVTPFDDVDTRHAHAEGEGDRTLASWRNVHERFWRAHSEGGFAPEMLVVLEAFELVHPTPARPSAAEGAVKGVGEPDAARRLGPERKDRDMSDTTGAQPHDRDTDDAQADDGPPTDAYTDEVKAAEATAAEPDSDEDGDGLVDAEAASPT